MGDLFVSFYLYFWNACFDYWSRAIPSGNTWRGPPYFRGVAPSKLNRTPYP
jgi:hypothetical protein